MAIPYRIYSDTTYPTTTEIRNAQAPRNWWAGDFISDDDAFFAWRAAALLGGLLFVLGLLYWQAATGIQGGFIALFLLCFLLSAFLAFLGQTEVALVLLGTAVVTGVVALTDPPNLIASPGALFSNPGAAGPDLYTVLALWAVGIELMVVGVFGVIRISREADSE